VEPPFAGNDVFSMQIVALGSDGPGNWTAGTVFEYANGLSPEVAYSIEVRNLSNTQQIKKETIELIKPDGSSSIIVNGKPLNFSANETKIINSATETAGSGFQYIGNEFAVGNYYFKATIEKANGEEYEANNVSTAHFAVVSEIKPVSVPDNNLALVPVIALVVLGIITLQNRKNKGKLGQNR
jgi:hypothetical protein